MMRETDTKSDEKLASIISYSFVALVCLLLGLGVILRLALDKKEKEIKDYETYVFELQEELSETKETLLNTQMLLQEYEDDIISEDMQFEEYKDTYDKDLDYLVTLSYKKEQEYNKQLELIKTFLSDDELYLLNYIQEGGEIEYVGNFKCTAYCTELYPHICGTGTGITASGEKVSAGYSVAVNRQTLGILPFGTRIYIEGVGCRCVQDVGGGVAKNQIDCAVDTHANALKWNGAGQHDVWILR